MKYLWLVENMFCGKWEEYEICTSRSFAREMRKDALRHYRKVRIVKFVRAA